MRILNTCVCMAALFALTPINATAQSAAVHPAIGNAPPRKVLNNDILKLPIKERQAWTHGAISQMISVYADTDAKLSACITAWYFGAGNGKELTLVMMKKYEDQRATSTLFVLANQACS